MKFKYFKKFRLRCTYCAHKLRADNTTCENPQCVNYTPDPIQEEESSPKKTTKSKKSEAESSDES